MIFAIDCGHNCPPDIGCQGIQLEDNLTKNIGGLVMKKLKRKGYQSIDVLPASAKSVTQSLQQRCDKANKAKADVYVSIHFNCFDGYAHGTEVFAMSDEGKKMAKLVLNRIVSLGYTNRDVRDGSYLYVLRNTVMPAILIECCFCDSKKDMMLYSADTMSTAIAEGLLDYVELKDGAI